MRTPTKNYLSWREVGHEMERARIEVSMPRSTLATHLRITATYLLDMERGNRQYHQRYIDRAMRFIVRSL